jgi:uncharacterized protein (DUF2141 family)
LPRRLPDINEPVFVFSNFREHPVGMRRYAIFAALGAAAVLSSSPAFAARLSVTVSGLRSAAGGVYIGLYATPSKFLNGTQVDAMRKVRASAGPITVTFDNLPPGVYAVGAYHDENNNDHLDTDLIGLPSEGYALSNGVRAVMSKPTFQQAAFSVGAGDQRVSLQIRY